MSAQAITGGPPPEDRILQRLERAMREGRLPDPRTFGGVAAYGLIGLALGFMIGA